MKTPYRVDDSRFLSLIPRNFGVLARRESQPLCPQQAQRLSPSRVVDCSSLGGPPPLNPVGKCATRYLTKPAYLAFETRLALVGQSRSKSTI